MTVQADVLGACLPCGAKWAPPLVRLTAWQVPHVARALATRTVLISAPPGYGPVEGLVEALSTSERAAVWVRLGPEDYDPATTLVALIAAARRLVPGFGLTTAQHMQRAPGPVAGWPPLFNAVGEELGQALPADAAIVVELDADSAPYRHVLSLIVTHLLPALPGGCSLILIAPPGLPPVTMPKGTARLGERELRLDAGAADRLARRLEIALSQPVLRRVTALTDGRALALAGLGQAGLVLGPKALERIVERAADTADLCARLAQSCLALHDVPSRRALALTLRLGYSHPALAATALGAGAPAMEGPWLQPLADGWARLHGLWRPPLATTLQSAAPEIDVLRRTADHLTQTGAVEQSVPLYLALGDPGRAAEVAAGAADCLMRAGRWATLEDWLARLPAEALREQPRLLCARAGIAAAEGRVDQARTLFAVAEAQFAARRDTREVCECLLAESELAARQGDLVHAEAFAAAASKTATATDLAAERGRAFWQLARLAVEARDWDKVLAQLSLARSAARPGSDPALDDAIDRAEAIVRDEQALCHQVEAQHQALQAARQAERQAAHRLKHVVQGVAATPYTAMLTPECPSDLPTPPTAPRVPSGRPDGQTSAAGAGALHRSEAGWWQHLWERVRRSRPPMTSPEPPPGFLAQRQSALDASPGAAIAAAPLDGAPPTGPEPASPAATRPIVELASTQHLAKPEVPELAHPLSAPPLQSADPPSSPPMSLSVYMLGPFRILLSGQPLTAWPSGRGRAVLKYLLAHRDLPTPRDVLMDVFWRDAAPESARNSLNVAIHSLRQALQTLADFPVVQFDNGAYRLNPSLEIWVDADELDRLAETGRQAERQGDVAAATAAYESACDLYDGDFLAEDPYDDWPAAPRERLRQLHLDCLDRLGLIYLDRGDYPACIHACKRILALEACHEDAHRRLMRCFSRTGRLHMALRQYHACVEALAAELDVQPDAATTALHQQIRRREAV